MVRLSVAAWITLAVISFFIFDRRERTIYIPSYQTWNDDVPVWAKTRRAEIMEKIRHKLGDKWRFEENPD